MYIRKVIRLEKEPGFGGRRRPTREEREVTVYGVGYGVFAVKLEAFVLGCQMHFKV